MPGAAFTNPSPRNTTLNHTESPPSKRIVPRGTSALESVLSCPLCGSDKLSAALEVRDHFLSQEVFTLHDCQACGFRITSPRPPQTEIDRYYHSEDYLSHSNRKKGFQDHLYQVARRWALGSKHGLIHRHKPKGTVLDIGCGTGEFLAYLMSRGYQVDGVEPEVKAREQAIANHGISVVPTMERLPNREHYQVVTMWHALEHVPDVRATLKRIFALLADNGLLVIAVPDRESWDARYYGAYWAAWDVPRHLSHFRRADILRLLHEHGFDVLETRRMWLDALYISLLSERYRGAGAIASFLLGSIRGTWSNFRSLSGKHPTSSSLFLAKKREV